MLKCSIESLNELFSQISARMPLYMPIDGADGRAAYAKWSEGAKWSDALNTVKSPKDFFFPQSEDLMRFKVSGKNIELSDVREEQGDFAVFGVRPCDVKSFEVLDRVFLAEPVDSYYAMKREKGIVISVACTRPSETCFCGTFDIDATDGGGDISCWKCEDALYMRANSEKGERLLSFLDCLSECDESAVNKQKEKTAVIMERLPLAGLTTDGFGGGRTEALFERPEWDELSRSCLGCGTCTFVCPTCQCYDIKDIDTGKGVIRYRCWDSCMYSEFTRMAHGNNRLTQKERFRQRFMHKLVYYPENNDGLFSCVGCGRCLSRCPISMNIVKVMKKLGGKENE
ncbi:MAG: 4Fe-4S dicluster domain-containing protein [Clostridia bacterium]|nr:4Fe-4S dicluster domain-containing protein [Clostridia bacterium]